MKPKFHSSQPTNRTKRIFKAGAKAKKAESTLVKRALVNKVRRMVKRTGASKTGASMLSKTYLNSQAKGKFISTPRGFSQRVVIKAHYIDMGKSGNLASANAHIDYITRDGVSKDADKGQGFSKDDDSVDLNDFKDRMQDDKRQFRFIVSPENAQNLDLKTYARDVMKTMEDDLETDLDWVAVEHHNTDNPHLHIVVRGVDDQGNELKINRDYMSNGMRNRAQEIATRDLGLRTEHDIQQAISNDIDKQRFTQTDRDILKHSNDNIIDTNAIKINSESDSFKQRMRIARLNALEDMGLASQNSNQTWNVSSDMEKHLKTIGQRNDIIKNLNRSVKSQDQNLNIYDRDAGSKISGKIVDRGLHDEHASNHYITIKDTDNNLHYVELDKFSEGDNTFKVGDEVRVFSRTNKNKKSYTKIRSTTAREHHRDSIPKPPDFDQGPPPDFDSMPPDFDQGPPADFDDQLFDDQTELPEVPESTIAKPSSDLDLTPDFDSIRKAQLLELDNDFDMDF